MLILGLFGIVIVFGLTCIGSGLWQIVTGRRNIWTVILILGLAFLVAGGAVLRGLDRGKSHVRAVPAAPSFPVAPSKTTDTTAMF